MMDNQAPDLAAGPPEGRSLRTWFAPRKNALFAALSILVVSLALWFYGGRWYQERLLLEQRAEAVSEVSARGSALSSAVNRRLARLQGLHAFVVSEGSAPDFEQKFEQFAADLYAGSRGIRNLAVAPESVVRHVYPLEGNENVLGYQPLLDPRSDVVADVQLAIDTGQVVLSGPLELLQGGPGIIARQAVYRDGRYWGLVNVVIDLPILLTESGVEGGSGQLVYALRNERGQVFHGSPSIFSSSPIITQVILSEGYWEMAGVPGDGWSALIWQPLLIALISGLLSIGLLTSVVYLTINRQIRLAAAVKQRTLELSAANTQLEHRVEERTLELRMLLNISRSISSTLELDSLMEQVLSKLLPVVDYTGGAILMLDDGTFTVRAYRGPFPQESTLGRVYIADNTFGRQLAEEQKPVLIPDLSAATPMALAFRQATGIQPDRNPYWRSFLAVPLIAREKVTGMLALHHQEPAIYTRENADLAFAFANQAAVAIENALLHEKSQRLAVLQERQRLARELHDSVSQALYGIALGTRTARKILERTPIEEQPRATIDEPLEYILSLSEGGLADMRALIFELRPESLELEGLAAALAKQAAALQARHRIPVETDLCQEPETSLQVKETLYRVAQEALHNIAKHAQATHAWIRLACEDDHLQLEIIDNGRGFDPEGQYPGHLGLRSMRERVTQLRGTLTIASSPGQGTRILATVPAGQTRPV